MRTSLIEIQKLEKWLLQQGDPGERLLTEVKLQLNPRLMDEAKWQATTYDLIQLYGREKLREEIKVVEERLFTSPDYQSFQNRIRSIFKR